MNKQYNTQHPTNKHSTLPTLTAHTHCPYSLPILIALPIHTYSSTVHCPPTHSLPILNTSEQTQYFKSVSCRILCANVFVYGIVMAIPDTFFYIRYSLPTSPVLAQYSFPTSSLLAQY